METPALHLLTTAVDAVMASDIDAGDDASLRRELGVLEHTTRRLQARTTRLVGTLQQREVRRACDRHPDDPRAAERARTRTAAEVGRQLGWAPSDVKATAKAARHLAFHPDVAAAFAAGEICGRNAKILIDTLALLADGDAAEHARKLLLDAARDEDPTTFGRTARTLLAAADADAAEDTAERLHRRRYGATSTGDDGMTHLRAGVAGVDAETVCQAIDTFRTLDPPSGPMRTPEQRTADALVAVCRHALDHHADPGRARPHVTVTIDWTVLTGQSPGSGTGAWSGPISAAEVRRLLDDATISRIVTGPDSLPLDVGHTARTVPTGTWRALVQRDRGCTWPGCTAPAAWCDAAHLHIRWLNGAGTSPAELALLCRHHHRHVDRHQLTGHIADGKIVWRPPDRQPADPERSGREPP